VHPYPLQPASLRRSQTWRVPPHPIMLVNQQPHIRISDRAISQERGPQARPSCVVQNAAASGVCAVCASGLMPAIVVALDVPLKSV